MIHLRAFFRNGPARATGIIFALCGLIFGTWAALIPFIKEKFGLDDAQLGLLLLCMPLGNLIANPLSIVLIGRWGAVRISLMCIVFMAISFTLPVIATGISILSIGLVLAGASFALTNVAMNTCASYLEEQQGKKLMSACHGMWSVGAMLGALFSGPGILFFKICCQQWVSPHLAFMFLIVLSTAMVAGFIKGDMQMIHADFAKKDISTSSGRVRLKPNRMLWILISISLCTFLTEGTVADWSAVYLREMTHAPEAIVGWGFAVYAFFMAAGRFVGDVLIARHGSMKILRMGGQLVVLGLLIVIVSHNPWVALPGFMLTGLGISVASPILFAAAARVPGLSPGVGLATMNSFGMAAFLGGPVLIGFIAQAFDLRIAFMFTAAAAVLWIVQTIVLSRKNVSP